MPMWPAWRLIAEGWATLEELETHWSIDDIQTANLYMDAWAEAQKTKK